MDQGASIGLEPSSTMSLQQAHDLYLALLNLGLHDDLEPFLREALELGGRCDAGAAGIPRAARQRRRWRDAALVDRPRVRGRGPRRRAAQHLPRGDRRRPGERRDHRHPVCGPGPALCESRQRAEGIHRSRRVRANRLRTRHAARSTCRDGRRPTCSRTPIASWPKRSADISRRSSIVCSRDTTTTRRQTRRGRSVRCCG